MKIGTVIPTIEPVPCNGCTLCCKGDAIRILPGEDASKFKTVPHWKWPHTERMLDHKPNGDCVYLGDTGCTIHHDKPLMCQQMDCRNLAQKVSFTQARKAAKSGFPFRVWRRGKDLLGEAK